MDSSDRVLTKLAALIALLSAARTPPSSAFTPINGRLQRQHNTLFLVNKPRIDKRIIDEEFNDDDDEDENVFFMQESNAKLEEWRELVQELQDEGYNFYAHQYSDYDETSDDSNITIVDKSTIHWHDEDDDDNILFDIVEEEPPFITTILESSKSTTTPTESTKTTNNVLNTSVINRPSGLANLENALLQGVVPVSAGVGSDCLPGDYGFDPLNLSSRDYIQRIQLFMLNNIVPSSSNNDKLVYKTRPRALILRDYREAEIRHGRLAMIAAVFWPLQELLDQLILDDQQFGPLVYGPVTLPFFPLIMTAIMLLLGYLDIYSQANRDQLGEAFLPGDCFWDPLSILGTAAPDRMKRNMQERELLNGRASMLAVFVYLWEEGWTHKALIDIPGNELLLKPAYQVPAIQSWLDEQFAFVAKNTAVTMLLLLCSIKDSIAI